MHAITLERIRVAVSHPWPLVVAGVSQLLSADPAIEVLPWTEGGPQRVDVLVADLLCALDLAASWRGLPAVRMRPRLVVLATAGREAEVRAALEAGIQGFLLSTCSPQELRSGVLRVASGAHHFAADALQSMVQSLTQEPLTQRETAVLALLVEGLGNKLIAQRLGIEVGTVKAHVGAILGKLGAANRTQAVNVATTRGLLPARQAQAPQPGATRQLARPWHRLSLSGTPADPG